jgi:branched-chain amino acid transport system ATP-binding protein
MSMLEIRDVHTYYGHIHALKGVSLTVEKGEIVTLIGSNGAGKSTMLRTISGLLQPRTGQILLQGNVLNGQPAHKVAGLGVAQSPEGRRVFPRMSVLENLEMGAFIHGKAEAADLDRVFELFPKLKERAGQKAGTMSGGEQQMLAIGRALMARPQVLLLDEPSLGLAPVIVAQIMAMIRALADNLDLAVLLVEQNARSALSIANRGIVLNLGRVVADREPGELAADERLRHAYLGF